MGGGKGSDDSSGGYAAPPPEEGVGDAEMMAGMMAMMEMMSAASAPGPAPAMPEAIAPPPIEKAPKIDWRAKQESLKAKSRADYKSETSKKKGRTQTIHTSPLLDSEDTSSAIPLLGSTKKKPKDTSSTIATA